MLSLYKYTETEIKTILKSLVILVDTREQANKHIMDYFERKKILYTEHKLDFGDYSYMFPARPDMGIAKDLYFTGDFALERKASLEELSNNFTKERTRFENKFLRALA